VSVTTKPQADAPLERALDSRLPSQPQTEPDDGLDLAALLLPLWRRKWIILLCGLLAAAAAAFVASGQRNSYTALARVIFEPERLRIIDLDSVVVTPDVTATGMRNQIEILRSELLLERVVDTLRLERAPEFNPALRNAPPGLLDRVLAQVPVPVPTPVRERLVSLGLLTPEEAAGLTDAERAERLRSRILNQLSNDIRLSPVPNSRVIEIGYTSENPVLAAAIVNATGEQYIVVQTERKRDDIAAASELLSVRVRDLENRLNRAEEAVRLAQLELSMGAEYGSALIQRQLETLNEALSEARLVRAGIESRYNRAAAALENGGDLQVVPDFRSSPVMGSYRAREVELLDQQASLRAIVAGSTNPTVVRLEARLEEVQRSMLEEAATIVAGLRSELEIAIEGENALREQMDELEARALEQSRAEMRLSRLEREAQASRVLHESFLTRMNETSEQAALQSPDARFLTRASVPDTPSSRSRLLIVFAGLVGGIGLAGGVVLLLDRLNDTLRSAGDVEARTGFAVLAGIPRVGRRKRPRELLATLLGRPDGPLAESTRNLRTSILFSNLDQSPKVIMFASSLPNEGKTTTAMLTAVTSQQMERTAIIVDCDLRRRMMGSLFPISPDQPGLFAALQGSSPVEEAVYVEPETGLHVLAPERVGAGLGNPADVLASRRFHRLIAQLKARYDLVILDTPPTLVVADARIVAQVADTVVYLSRWNKSRSGSVIEGIRQLRSVGARIAGVTLTMVDERQSRKYMGNEGLYKRSYGASATG
jgi:polysaccharide biosynthesis transport protein